MSSHEALATAVDLARAAANAEAGDEPVGGHVGTHVEDETALTHLFEANKPGYRGWRWAVTVSSSMADEVTVSEVVLLPGPEALTAPAWVPWEERVRAGDLGVGDLMPTAPDDPRLVPGYLLSDDPAVDEVALEIGLGRERVLSRDGRLDAAQRWQDGEFGPRSDMARSAPAHCGTCGFYVRVAGSLQAAFGVCGNDLSPADGHVVHVEYGCGAHSEVEIEQVSPVLVADLIYDDADLEVERTGTPKTPADQTPETAKEPDPAAAVNTAAVDTTDAETVAKPAESNPAGEPEAAIVTTETAKTEPVAEPLRESTEPGPTDQPEAAIVTTDAPHTEPASEAVREPAAADSVDETKSDVTAEAPQAEPVADGVREPVRSDPVNESGTDAAQAAGIGQEPAKSDPAAESKAATTETPQAEPVADGVREPVRSDPVNESGTDAAQAAGIGQEPAESGLAAESKAATTETPQAEPVADAGREPAEPEAAVGTTEAEPVAEAVWSEPAGETETAAATDPVREPTESAPFGEPEDAAADQSADAADQAESGDAPKGDLPTAAAELLGAPVEDA